MKQIVFVSGKGGTGKTSLTAALSALSAPVVMADLDVDAANLALLHGGTPLAEFSFMGQPRAKVDETLCTGCGECLLVCAFGAMAMRNNVANVNGLSCVGCHACALVCQDAAISFVSHQSGVVRIQAVETGTLVHAALGAGEDNSGKLVSEVRKVAQKETLGLSAQLLFLDGPPGIGCPVHAAVNNVDLAVIVTEPSASGISDFERILLLCRQFGLQVAVIVNKADLAPRLTGHILQRCQTEGIPVAGTIAFSKEVPATLTAGKTLLTIPAMQPVIREIHGKLMKMLRADGAVSQ